MYFADEQNQRIRKVSAGGTMSTVVGTGAGGASGDAAAATSADLLFALGVGVADGVLVISDTNNNRVRRVDPATGIITTAAGQVDPEGVGPAATARLADPQAIALGASFTLVAGGTSGTLEAMRAGHSPRSPAAIRSPRRPARSRATAPRRSGPSAASRSTRPRTSSTSPRHRRTGST